MELYVTLFCIFQVSCYHIFIILKIKERVWFIRKERKVAYQISRGDILKDPKPQTPLRYNEVIGRKKKCTLLLILFIFYCNHPGMHISIMLKNPGTALGSLSLSYTPFLLFQVFLSTLSLLPLSISLCFFTFLSTTWLSSSTTGHIPRENHNSKRYMHPNIHSSTIYHSQDMEAT